MRLLPRIVIIFAFPAEAGCEPWDCQLAPNHTKFPPLRQHSAAISRLWLQPTRCGAARRAAVAFFGKMGRKKGSTESRRQVGSRPPKGQCSRLLYGRHGRAESWLPSTKRSRSKAPSASSGVAERAGTWRKIKRQVSLAKNVMQVCLKWT